MLFIYFVFLAFIVHDNVGSDTQSLKNIHKFVVGLRNNSDSMTEYVAKIQAIFCPEQPFCGELASETREDVMNTLPKTLNVENDKISVEQLQALIGVCCLPCSCEDTCKEDNNCCLTKALENKTIHNKMESSVNSTCIAATSKSYLREFDSGSKYPHYFMITQCFFTTTVPNQSNCETPNPYDMADTIPVTSLSSGRTYWNQHCAKCNNDADNIVFWNMTVMFRGDIIFYGNSYGIHFYDTSLEEVSTNLLRRQEIMLTPPFHLHHKRCVPQKYQNNCRRKLDDVQEADNKFLYETCNMFTSPLITGKRRNVINKNIFCLICGEETFQSQDKYECSFSGDEKNPAGAMTALFNYRHLDETETATDDVNSHGNGHCSCREIYDKFQEKCRPVYCPPGSLYSGCRCTEFYEAVFGMPILLKLKVTAEPGSVYPSSDVLAAKFRKALQKEVENYIGNVSVDIVASFRQQNETNAYQLYVAVIRSDFRHDTKETLKLLLDYMYADKFLKITTNEKRYLVRLDNKITLRRIGNRFVSAFDLQSQTELILDYANTKYYSGQRLRIYQILSPILFCKQVQLDSSEFTETDWEIIVNTTSAVISLSDFYRTPANQVRVCLEQYLPTPLISFGNTNGSVTITLVILLFCLYLALQQAWN